MIALVVTLACIAAPAAPVPAAASDAVAAALAVPAARVEVRGVRISSGASCATSRVEVLRPVTGSGEVPLRLSGTGPDGRACQAFGWAEVRVTASGLVAARTIRAGEPLEGAVAPRDVELRPGRAAPIAALPAGGRASRTLAAGAPISEADVNAGPLPGEAITVIVRAGGLELSQDARAVPCTRGRACALLPGGRRVEGRLEDGHLLLETP